MDTETVAKKREEGGEARDSAWLWKKKRRGWHGMGQRKLSRETKFSGAIGDKFIFPVQAGLTFNQLIPNLQLIK